MRLTLILDAGSDTLESGHFRMAEEWIRQLAKQLIEVDTPAALEIQARDRTDDMIRSKGPAFFKTFAEHVRYYADEIAGQLKDSAVASEQKCSIPSNYKSMKLERLKLPFITMTATLALPENGVTIDYCSSNPEKPTQVKPRAHALPF